MVCRATPLKLIAATSCTELACRRHADIYRHLVVHVWTDEPCWPSASAALLGAGHLVPRAVAGAGPQASAILEPYIHGG
jgi:hypothetical protein